MPFILPGNVGSATAATGFNVANSCRFNAADDPYMHKTPGSAGNRRTFTLSYWIKSSVDGYHFTVGSDNFQVRFTSNAFFVGEYASGSYAFRIQTTRVFRDPSAWYHIVVAFDTTQGTAGNRVKIYVNGVQETSFSTSNYPSENYDTSVNNGVKHQVGVNGGISSYLNAYLAEVCLIDGSALAPTSFGEFDEDSPAIWKPIDVSGLTFGTNGFYLDFEASGNLGNDANGGTDLTEVNLAATDQSTDTCTNNFATGNPLDNGCGKAPTFSEGNLKYVSSSTFNFALPTIGVSSGKWYMEIKYSALGSGGSIMAGITDQFDNTNRDLTGNAFAGGEPLGIGYYQNGNKYLNNVASSYGSTYTTGDIIGVYLDVDNSKLYFAKNGTLQNSGTGLDLPSSANSTGVFFFMPSVDKATIEVNYGNPTFTGTDKADANGYGSFEYDPSVGTFDGASKDFYALCTKNLAEYG